MTEWLDLIKNSNSVALFSHINSDGDAVGSVMAFKHLLESMNKEVYVFIEAPISESFCFLDVDKISCKKSAKEYDLAIGLDCPNTKRFGVCESEYFKAKKTLCIDHHMDNVYYADLTILEPDISSTCELIYKLFKESNIKITKEIATCLYTGISTDTGGFMHGNHGVVDASTFNAVADLAVSGAEIDKINYNVFVHVRKSVYELYKYAISNVKFFENGKIAMVTISKNVLEQTGAHLTDTHKFTDFIGGIDGVEITAIMSQKEENEQSVSVRSRVHNAQRICKHFGGGGHLRAAGCRLFVPFHVAKKQLLDECKKELYRND